MDASTTARHTRSEQCRRNAQAKSEQKRQATFAAIGELRQEKHPVTRSVVARRVGVLWSFSVVILTCLKPLRMQDNRISEHFQRVPQTKGKIR